MNALQKLYFRGWRLGVIALSLATLAYLLYFHRLVSLLPGYSTPEIKAFMSAASWHNIAANPVNAPYSGIVWLCTAVFHQGILATRVVAASFGILAVLVFFTIIRHLYSFGTVFLCTLLFATSAGFLHAARFGTGLVLQLGVLMLISSLGWYRRTSHRILAGYWLAVLFGLLLYVPGMVWFELLAIGLAGRAVGRQLLAVPKYHLTAWFIVVVALAVPLVLASSKNSHIALIATGLPLSLHSLTHFGSNILHAVMSIAFRSDGSPLFWVGHAPVLNAIEAVLAILGAYYYLYYRRAPWAKFAAASIVLGLVLIGFGGSVGYVCIVPLLYLFVAGGVNHLLEQWFTVFPRNPIARYTGVALVCVMLFFSVLYQVRSYYVAWPHSVATRQAFSQRAPD